MPAAQEQRTGSVSLIDGAWIAGLSYGQLLRLVTRHEVEGWRDGRSWMCSRGSLEEWIAQRQRDPAA
jgi:hypothetical protein